MRYFQILRLLSVFVTFPEFIHSHGYFWQLTDVHYDANYTEHAFNKTAKLCASQYGDYKCDSPWLLVKSAISAMKELKEDADFILWTGDSVPHAPDTDLNGAKVFTLVKNVTDLLKETFPNTRVFPVLGNHDVWPKDEVPVTADDYFKQIFSFSGWDYFLKGSAADTFQKGGYYVEEFGPWRIFGLNTVVWYNRDSKSATSSDPGNQTLWLNKQLYTAKNDGKKVLITGHVPPGFMARSHGVKWFYDRFNSEFHKILSDFSQAISASIFGHEHTDSFRIVYNNQGVPAVSMFLAPAVTPWNSTLPGIGANNPSLRLYKYDNTTGEILDYVQYFLNLAKTNEQQKPTWEKEYSLVETFTQSDASPASLHKLVEEFAKSGSSSFQKYYKFNSVSYDTNTKCKDKCKMSQLCAISCIEKASFEKCMNQSVYSQVCGVPKILGSSMKDPNHSEEMSYYLIGTLVAIAIILAFMLTLFYTRRKRRTRDTFYPDYSRVPLTA